MTVIERRTDVTGWIVVMAMLVALLVTIMIYCGYYAGRTSVVLEMQDYGYARIDGKTYTIEEVISGDK